MNRPDTVVFDLGKVLVDFDYRIAARKIAARSGRTAAEVQAFIDHAPLLFRYETGRLTRQQFYQEVVNATGFEGTLTEFSSYFADIFTPIHPMVSLQAELRARRVPTYIFSNTNDLAIEHIRRRFPFFSGFDGYVLSYEEGVMKPDSRIYESVERVTGRCGQQIVYLDDRPENVEAGCQRGWHGILHQTPHRSRETLKELGLPLP